MSALPLTWVDVFCDGPLAGNQLAVVHEADGLDDDAMLAFARETNLSETTFVQSGDDEADYRNRIWMTTGELPLAGHPSLGTAVAVARHRGESSARYVQRTPAGLQPMQVELDGLRGRAAMLQEPAQHGAELDPETVLPAVGLGPSDGVASLPVQLVSTGAWQILCPVVPEALAHATARPELLAPLLQAHDAVVAYVFAWPEGEPQARARSFFVDAAGVGLEDPATGSAAGPLLAYLHERAGLERLTIAQGVEMGRPSTLDCSFAEDRVRVAGEVVVIAEGVVHL